MQRDSGATSPVPTIVPTTDLASRAQLRERALRRIAPLDTDVLLAHALGVTKEAIYADPDALVPPEQVKAFDALVQRRASGEPVAYLRGWKEFYGLRFAVDP